LHPHSNGSDRRLHNNRAILQGERVTRWMRTEKVVREAVLEPSDNVREDGPLGYRERPAFIDQLDHCLLGASSVYVVRVSHAPQRVAKIVRASVIDATWV
jgi:hypothetical protein